MKRQQKAHRASVRSLLILAVSALGLLSGVLMLPAASQANRMNQADQKNW